VLAFLLALGPMAEATEPAPTLKEELSAISAGRAQTPPPSGEVPVIAFAPQREERSVPMSAGAAAVLVGGAVLSIGAVGALLLLRQGTEEGPAAGE